MQTTNLVLASASPRRHGLVQALGLDFSIQATDAEERTDPVPPAIQAALPAIDLPVLSHPTLLAWRKAQAVRDAGHAGPILAADTIVVLQGTILGKPRDDEHARTMLRQLAGTWHTVYTGLTVLPHASSTPLFDLVQAQVRLAPVDAQTIATYVATGEPRDKAGAYGIQGLGGRLVEQVEGSFTAVVGLPLIATATLLHRAGVPVPRTPEEAWQIWRQSIEKEPLCIQQSMC